MNRPYCACPPVFALLALLASFNLVVSSGLGCSGNNGTDTPSFPDVREPCADRNPLRNVYFGDLHVHTKYSFDSYIWHNRNSPEDAYAFAKGAAVQLPPLDNSGRGTREVRLDRPLDFVAVSDHGEFLAEGLLCTEGGEPGFDSELCREFREGTNGVLTEFGSRLLPSDPTRFVELCGDDGSACVDPAQTTWKRLQTAAEAAYDRTSACELTTFVAYEWTGNTQGRNLHRNVIFRNSAVPNRPVSYMEAPSAESLWSRLISDCVQGVKNCDVLAIPHNSNLSNGGMFSTQYPGANSEDEQKEQAKLRQALEPLMEVFQHKGGSECVNGLSGVLGDPDELCDIEQIRPTEDNDCGDSIGFLGITNNGCVSRNDFLRGALLSGLKEQQRLGVNPFLLGVTASTDTHNGTPGLVAENAFAGHVGRLEDAPERRLASTSAQPAGLITNPGGLAGVWARENSRNEIFDALARRESFGTSGPRIAPRFFAARNYPRDLCSDPDLLEKAYASGVPMGDFVPAGTQAPTFLALAAADPADGAAPLEKLQVVKGWLDSAGNAHAKVFDIATADSTRELNTDTCEATGEAAMSLCTVWTDPEYDPGQAAYYYLRVVEAETCRWSWRECISLPIDARPAGCIEPTVDKVVRELAWTSPIWHSPDSP